ncbi:MULTISPECIES: SDR family NAD(P)-dependent oxidoreductase [unclassified Paraburkholderia]|uniref:SDR family NAD(P)-dependent oxidoreductase n=1 Tax=unclassified Paraburkholderia TaxID=2615204 RepID=UPI00161FFCC6|nr:MULTISPECIES: SDR family oxidoreductase [unclassified Paraburkholderia]MBB5409778.1 NAD(P)-dependent dehydrogenase (short-subunit alcohol dehydrogenase family) [Paraburkholderia sp. HC6.4b]MBB5451753.1 NAD(P)-dependent dehydrogenase (short-subunit alcohol dehydrogenase family) [Paraburkholderia sp. Kb1A]
MKTVLITGVSRGIGAALSRAYLARGYQVCGIARVAPLAQPGLHFVTADLTDFDHVKDAVADLHRQVGGQQLDTLFLNAGTFGEPPARAERVDTHQFLDVIRINVAAVKATLDACLNLGWRPRRAVASASVSGKRPRAGMVSYATSKAALNALIKIYQLENPDIEFLPLGLCNVGTDAYSTMTSGVGADLSELHALKQRASTPGYVVTADERARAIIDVLEVAPSLNLTWGEFYEIRELLPRLSEIYNQQRES